MTTAAQVQQVYGAIMRSTLNSFVALATAAQIDNGGISGGLYGIDDPTAYEGKVMHDVNATGANVGDNVTVPAITYYAHAYQSGLSAAGLTYLTNYDIGLKASGFSDQNVAVNLFASATTAHASVLNSTIDFATAGVTRANAIQAIYDDVFHGTASSAVQAAASAAIDFYVGYAGTEDGARGCLWGAWQNSVDVGHGSDYAAAKTALDNGAHGTGTFATW